MRLQLKFANCFGVYSLIFTMLILLVTYFIVIFPHLISVSI